MLYTLNVKNIALIKEATLEFGKGLNVLSGETGAGKSIIIDSLDFVLGDRADKSLIRHGEKTATVQAVFGDDGNPEIGSILDEYGIERDESIIVKRSMSEAGRSDCRINGTVVTLGQLRRLMSLLVDIHSQHETQSLLNESNHIKILDNYSKKVKKLIAELGEHLLAYRAAKKEYESFEDEAARQRRIDLLEYRLAEIERVNPEEGEEERLVATRNKYQNSERIVNALGSAYAQIDGDDGIGALSAVQFAKKELNSIVSFDERYSEYAERLDSVKIELRDIADSLQSEIESSAFNPNELADIEKRIDEIRKIKRRFGGEIKDLADFCAQANAELEVLRNAELRLRELDAIMSKEGERIVALSKAIHAERGACAKDFEKAIIVNLRELGMKSATFSAEIIFPQDDDAILLSTDTRGADEVRFMISPNLGEPLKPLAKIASGGEMSRFMLGLKNITAELEGVETLVFDEIDTGISGAVAKVVACKLYDVAKERQVLAVTHLPQLASMADHHYLIEKTESDGKTQTSITPLSEEERVREVARLAGSDIKSVVGIQNAEESIKWAKSYKNAK